MHCRSLTVNSATVWGTIDHRQWQEECEYTAISELSGARLPGLTNWWASCYASQKAQNSVKCQCVCGYGQRGYVWQCLLLGIIRWPLTDCYLWILLPVGATLIHEKCYQEPQYASVSWSMTKPDHPPIIFSSKSNSFKTQTGHRLSIQSYKWRV